MAQTYKQIQRQIEQLQRQAEALRNNEVKGVVERIKVAIAHYGLTAGQLGLGASKTTAKPKKTGSSSGKGTARFSDGNGNAWSGRGPRPVWLRNALAAGRSIDEFRVGSTAKSKPVSAGRSVVPIALPPIPPSGSPARRLCHLPAPPARKQSAPRRPATGMRRAIPGVVLGPSPGG